RTGCVHEDRGADGRMAAGTPGAAAGIAGGVAAGAGRTRAHLGAGVGARRGRVHPRARCRGRALVLAGAPDRGVADLGELDAALGELRAAGWPAPEDPDGGDDAELDGRGLIADRLVDEVSWLRQCADWL